MYKKLKAGLETPLSLYLQYWAKVLVFWFMGIVGGTHFIGDLVDHNLILITILCFPWGMILQNQFQILHPVWREQYFEAADKE